MTVLIDPRGTARAIYSEVLDLTALGACSIQRASVVEPDGLGQWWADLALSGGPVLGPFRRRSEALAAEVGWLERHRL
jgi:hypothetical protein